MKSLLLCGVLSVASLVISPATMVQADEIATQISNDTFDGKLRLQSGAKYRISYYIESDTSEESLLPVPEGKVKRQSTLTYSRIKFDENYDVISVDSYGNYQIRITYGDLLVKFQTVTKELPALTKTEDKSEKFSSTDVNGLKNASFLVKVSPNNKLVSIYGFDTLRARMLKRIATLSPLKQRAAQEFVTEFLTDHNTTKNFVKLAGQTPSQTVRVGESWDTAPKIPVGAVPTPVVHGERRLITFKDGAAVIKDNERFTLKGASKAAPEQPDSLIDIEGVRSAMTYVIRETGLLRNFRESQNMRGTISVNTGPENTLLIKIAATKLSIIGMRERTLN